MWLLLLLLAALTIALPAVGPRNALRTWWLLAGLAACAVLAAPAVIWQALHDFPLLTVARASARTTGSVLIALSVVPAVLGSLPILPSSALAPVIAINPEQGEQVGWREFALTVQDAFFANDYPTVITRNYGRPGTIEAHTEVHAWSGHMSFYAWGLPVRPQEGPPGRVRRTAVQRLQSRRTTTEPRPAT